MSAADRIEWLHKKISDNSYPGIAHLIEKFDISRRQAQRDVEYLRDKLGAPLKYSPTYRGYYYTEPFSLPFMTQNESDADFGDVLSAVQLFNAKSAKSSVLQLQLPYTATLEISDRMAVLNLRSLIIRDLPRNRYVCQFSNVDFFLGILMTSGVGIKIEEPIWLRQKLIDLAKSVLTNNIVDNE